MSGTIGINQGTSLGVAADTIGGTYYGIGKIDISPLGAAGTLFNGTVGVSALPNTPGGTLNNLASGTINAATVAQLPAAAALADASGNPTTSQIGANVLGYDGVSAWYRINALNGASDVIGTSSVGLLVGAEMRVLNGGTAWARLPGDGTNGLYANVKSLVNLPGGTLNNLASGTINAATITGNLGTLGTIGLATVTGNVGVSTGTINVSTISTLPNTPGGTINLATIAGNLGTLGTVGLATVAGNVGVSSGTINVSTISTLPNTPGGTINLATVTGNVGISSGTINVSTISALPNTPGGTINLATITGNIGTLGTIGLATARLDARPAQNIISFGTQLANSGAAAATIVGSASVGAGTALWVNDFSIMNPAGSVLCVLGFGTAQLGTNVLFRGVLGTQSAVGIEKAYAKAVNAGMTNQDLVFSTGGAGTVDLSISYFISA